MLYPHLARLLFATASQDIIASHSRERELWRPLTGWWPRRRRWSRAPRSPSDAEVCVVRALHLPPRAHLRLSLSCFVPSCLVLVVLYEQRPSCDRRAAAVSKAAGQPLEMEEVEVAPPRAHEVRVRIICTSLCHTDITFWRMKVRIKSVKCFGRVSSHDFLSFNFRFSSI